jgi:hypothetical protein
MKTLLALLALLFTAPGSAAITQLEYSQGLRVYPEDGSPYEYRIHVSGLERFAVYLERWEWRSAGRGTSTLIFKDEIQILDGLPLDINHGPEDLLHESVTLRRLQGRSPEGSVFLDLGDGRFGSEKLALTSPRLAPYFPAPGPITFKLSLGATKRLHGAFAPALTDAEEKKVCWDWDEYRSAGCELSTTITVWGNEVDHLTDARGARIFGDLEQGAANRGRLKRQGFLRLSVPGHLKGKAVQLRDAAGRVLLETRF